MDAVYDGDLDNGDWVVAELEFTSGDAVAGGEREIRKSFLHIQQAFREGDVEVPYTLLEPLYSLAEQSIDASFLALFPSLECLEARKNALCEEFSHF